MKAAYVVCMMMLAGIILFSTMAVFSYHKDAGQNARENEEVIREVTQRMPDGDWDEKVMEQIDSAKLKQMNADAIGWIVFNDPYVNNPLVQTDDNSYYLKHSFMKKENAAGSLFMDYRNESFDDRNVVIYGHNMLDRTMFGSLKDVFQEKFWESPERDIIWIIDSEQHLRQYKIFSYYVVEKEDDYITTSFSDAAAYTDFLGKITARSFRKLDVTVTADDHILTLSTCAGAAGTNKRRVIHAKLIEISSN